MCFWNRVLACETVGVHYHLLFILTHPPSSSAMLPAMFHLVYNLVLSVCQGMTFLLSHTIDISVFNILA